MTVWLTEKENRRDFTFAELVEGREDEFPTIARAAKDTRPAHAVKVEWLVGDRHNLRCEHNYQQIFRRQFGSLDKADGALTALLSDVEHALKNGRRDRLTSGAWPISTMGGYRYYLPDLNESDRIALRPLQEPMLRKWEKYPNATPKYRYEYEWLCEVSLQVVPAAVPAAPRGFDMSTFIVYTTKTGGEYHAQRGTRAEYEEAKRTGFLKIREHGDLGPEYVKVKMVAFAKCGEYYDHVLQAAYCP